MHKFVVPGVGSLTLGLVVSSLCLAQSRQAPASSRFTVTYTQVKPEMAEEYIALQKNEVTPAYKKAGVKSRNLMRTRLGNTYEFVSVRPLDSYAELDGPSPLVKALGQEGSTKLLAKLRRCTTSTRTFVTTRHDDLSVPADGAWTVAVSSRSRIAPGKRTDYENLVRTEILPLNKKAKAEGKILGHQVSRRGLGAFANEVTSTTYYAKFADIEGGTVTTRMLGPEGAAKLGAKFTGISTIVEQVVRTRIADSSF